MKKLYSVEVKCLFATKLRRCVDETHRKVRRKNILLQLYCFDCDEIYVMGRRNTIATCDETL